MRQIAAWQRRQKGLVAVLAARMPDWGWPFKRRIPISARRLDLATVGAVGPICGVLFSLAWAMSIFTTGLGNCALRLASGQVEAKIWQKSILEIHPRRVG